jgi:1-acyl-sn-glycerol-3-phosphate acyltransferase
VTDRRSTPGHGRQASPLARRSAPLVGFMGWYFSRYVGRHLDGLRLARWGQPPVMARPAPLVIYANHPSWWDAAVFVVLATRLFPERPSYGPIDAQMLRKYPFFERLGMFGIEPGGRRGAAAFLATSREVLSRPESALWITAQGRFADARERPLRLQPGIAHLAQLAPDAVFLPLALEYVFWEERGAEALAAFGRPVTAAGLLALPRPARLESLEGQLTTALERLSLDAISREPQRFTSLLVGRAGIGGIYDGWRRLKALASGTAFDPAHSRRLDLRDGAEGGAPSPGGLRRPGHWPRRHGTGSA